MPYEILDLILNLVKTMAVIMVVAYVLGRTELYTGFLEGRRDFRTRLMLILVFGLFSIYGTWTESR